MTYKQILFADFVLQGMSGAKAAIKAGYSEATATAQACKLMDPRYHPEVSDYIAQERAKLSEKRHADVEWVLQGFIRDAENPENTVRDRMRARELVGKMLGCFEEKIAVRTEDIDPAMAAAKMNSLMNLVLARKNRAEAAQKAALVDQVPPDTPEDKNCKDG